MRRTLACAVLVCGSLVLTPAAARAALLTGSFSIAGLGDVRVGPDYIDWGQAGNVFGPSPGDIMFISGNGSFAGINGTQGTVKDLTSAADPVGVPINEPDFLTSAAHPTWDFTLEFIYPGTGTAAGCTAAPGAVCTPFLGSPFTITNLAGGGSSVAFRVQGSVSDGSSDPASAFVGAFTTQFATLTALDLINQLTEQGFVQSSHSAQFDLNVVPEPASSALLGGGLAMLASFMKRRRKQGK